MNIIQYIREKFNLDFKISKKNLELKDLNKKIKLTELDYQRLLALKFKERENIYNEIRKDRLNKNNLIELNGYEIVLSVKKKSFLSQIPILNLIFKEKPSENLKALYFGYGNQAKFIDIELLNNTSNYNKKELYNIKYSDKNYFINGSPLKFINKDIIFDAEFDNKKNSFVYDLTPEYYYNYINNVVDYRLTNPLQTGSSLIELLKKYWWLILIMLGIYYFSEKDKNKTTPLILPFIFFYKETFINWLKK